MRTATPLGRLAPLTAMIGLAVTALVTAALLIEGASPAAARGPAYFDLADNMAMVDWQPKRGGGWTY
jgi:hypothetical protein